MQTILLSFDLEDAQPNDYEPVYKALAEVGLFRCSPHKSIHLPDTTVLGDIDHEGDASEIREHLTKVIKKAAKHEVKTIVVGILLHWSSWGTPDPLTKLKDLVRYIQNSDT